MNELWRGGLSWTGNSLKLILLFFTMVVCPPVWIFFSLPLNIKYNCGTIYIYYILYTMWQSLHCWCVFRMNKVPYIKFICRTVSHFFFLLLLILTGRNSQCWWSYQAWMFQPAFPSTRSRTVQPLCRSGTSGCCSVSLPSQYK